MSLCYQQKCRNYSSTVALVNQTALRALCFYFNKLAHNMQARPWALVSILALLHDNKLIVSVSNFYVQSRLNFGRYDGMIATSEE